MKKVLFFNQYLLISILACTLFQSNQILTGAQEVFTQIYTTNFWANEESVSGSGSTLQETAILRKILPILLQSLNIQTMLDAPCGDHNWIKHIDLTFLNKYIGVDVVQDIIANNKALYECKGKEFRHLDILEDELPYTDLILCRDCLVHFPHKFVWQALNQMKASGARYLLTTTYPDLTQNMDIQKIGWWRPLNLQKPPFNFPEPLIIIHEGVWHEDKGRASKSIALWDFNDLALTS